MLIDFFFPFPLTLFFYSQVETLNDPPVGLKDFLNTQSVSEAIAEKVLRRTLMKHQAELTEDADEKKAELRKEDDEEKSIEIMANYEKKTKEISQKFEDELSKLELKDEKPTMDEFNIFIEQLFESLSSLNNELIAKRKQARLEQKQAHSEALDMAHTKATKIVEVSTVIPTSPNSSSVYILYT